MRKTKWSALTDKEKELVSKCADDSCIYSDESIKDTEQISLKDWFEGDPNSFYDDNILTDTKMKIYMVKDLEDNNEIVAISTNKEKLIKYMVNYESEAYGEEYLLGYDDEYGSFYYENAIKEDRDYYYELEEMEDI